MDTCSETLIIPLNIEHQTQPSPNSCVATCIAMLIAAPANDVVAKWHDSYWIRHEVDIYDILMHYGLKLSSELSSSSFGRMHPGYVYLLCVPSLNCRGMFHEVLLDWRDPEQPRLYDPAKGYNERMYYVLTDEESDEEEKAVRLTSWVIDAAVEANQ